MNSSTLFTGLIAGLLTTSLLVPARADDPVDFLASGGFRLNKHWELKDGILGSSKTPGGILWSKQKYGDFQVTLDYKTSDQCNSGLFFRSDPRNPVQGGFEIQIASDGLYAGKHVVGSLYDAKAPSKAAGKPDGEWNTMTLTCRGPNITVVLNGEQVLEANIDDWTTPNTNPDGSKNKFKTALKNLPRSGHLGLQYHGKPIWFRNIRVTSLDNKPAPARNGTATAAASPSTSSGQGQPNILLILSDDHAKKALSCYGNTDIQTPGLDRLANEGMRFDHALTPNSFCTPARAAVLTGKYSHKNGVTHLNQSFDGSQQTFPKLLQAAGYETSLFGKWHLLSQPTGFDFYCVQKMQGMPFDPIVFETGMPWIPWSPKDQKSYRKGGRVLKGYNNDAITTEALNWLKEKRDPNKPFCMCLHPKPPHQPYKPPKKYEDFLKDITIPEPATLLDDYKGRTPEAIQDKMSANRLVLAPSFKKLRAKLEKANPKITRDQLTRAIYQEYIKGYYRLVKSVDDNVGRVLDYLDESGLDKKTIVIYTSDQGFSLGEHGFYNKQWMYEGPLHQPLLVRFPGAIKPGSVHDSMVSHVDLAPTILEYAGVSVPEDMQGHSLKPILEGKAEKVRDAAYYHFYDHGTRLPEMIGIRTETHKLIHYPEMKGKYQWEMFDLQNDPEEMNNLYGSPEHQETRESLKSDLRKLIKELDDPVDAPNLMKAALKKRAEMPTVFDGKSLDNWSLQNGKPVPSGWEVIDGTIHRKASKKRVGHIVTRHEYGDFDLSFEWKLPKRGNSGVKYRVRKYGGKMLGCEYQIFNVGKTDKPPGKRDTGAIYSLFEPDPKRQLNPSGQFNASRIVVRGDHIEHWLNGRLIVSATVGSPEWETRVAESKFSDVPHFGRNRLGRIMLTDHGAEVWYRNFKISTPEAAEQQEVPATNQRPSIAKADASEKPNVILIMADDIAYDNLGCYGSEYFKTPRLDELARTGIQFNYCYSEPVCTPSRVKIMTGRDNIRNYTQFGRLDPKETTFGTMMKEAGYATAIAGKWQLHDNDGALAPYCGFDTFCLWNYPGTERPRYWNPSLIRDGKKVPTTKDSYGPDICTDFLIEFIENNKDRPFFAYYPMLSVHSPFLPTPDSADRNNKNAAENYRDMVRYMDKCVGRLVDALDKNGLRENTIVMFTTDNGTDRGLTYPYKGKERKGEKAWPTDGGCHAPLIVNCPGTVASGAETDDLVDFSDVMPTLAEIGGARLPNVTLDGRSFWPQCVGKEGNPREWIFQYYYPKFKKAAQKHGAGKPYIIWAQDQHYKLYSHGKFIAVKDRHEVKNIPPGTGSPEAEAARKKLQIAINSMPRKGVSSGSNDDPRPQRRKSKSKSPQAAKKADGQTGNRPNIVLMMSDDQGWGETGYNGHPYLKTPVLDEMATSGLRLDRFYAASPVCTPTRASVLTGRHANRSGAFGAGWSIRPEEVTLAPLLKAAGYRTAHFGKWHVGAIKEGSPLSPGSLGFDESLSHDNFFELNPELSRNGKPAQRIEGESSEILVKEALNFAAKSQNADKPFFIVIWFGSPHSPYESLENDRAPYKPLGEELSHRLGEIAAMDRAIGMFRDGLDDLGQRNNTLLWFNSDNGITVEGVPKEQQAELIKGSGLRGHKAQLYEGGLRVPGIIEWPAVITAARSSSVPCVTSDIMPTLLDILDVRHPDPQRPLDGISLKKLIVDGTMQARPTPIGFWGYDQKPEQTNEKWIADNALNEMITMTAKQKATFVKRPDTKWYFKNHQHPVAKSSFEGTAAWMDGRYKLVIGRGRRANGYELYDLEADRGEANNIASSNPDKVSMMVKQLRAWQQSLENSLTGADYAK